MVVCYCTQEQITQLAVVGVKSKYYTLSVCTFSLPVLMHAQYKAGIPQETKVCTYFLNVISVQ